MMSSTDPSPEAQAGGGLRKRLVICVDGPNYTEDRGASCANHTNAHRIWASIREGWCADAATGEEVWQLRPKYVRGTSAEAEFAFSLREKKKKRSEGGGGRGGQSRRYYGDKVREVYEICCGLSERDEVWLYGFSRGAWVVRAVASLLHTLQAIKATTTGRQFRAEFDDLLRIYRETRKKGSNNRQQLSKVSRHRYTFLCFSLPSLCLEQDRESSLLLFRRNTARNSIEKGRRKREREADT